MSSWSTVAFSCSQRLIRATTALVASCAEADRPAVRGSSECRWFIIEALMVSTELAGSTAVTSSQCRRTKLENVVAL